ncbi:MAG: helix-turn-helix transcriptional regulator [Chlorobium sp.]|nr:helix-turn-helix transcriptional regulator [Chlorobium sp.]
MTEYGQLIATERESQNMSRRTLAEMTDIPETSLRRLESGGSKSDPAELQKIARALAMNETKLIDAWLIHNLEGINYSKDVLKKFQKPDLEFAEIEAMYGIELARRAFEHIRSCTSGKQMKAVNGKALLEVRVGLKNCLGLIDDLKEG